MLDQFDLSRLIEAELGRQHPALLARIWLDTPRRTTGANL
jgi:hypothetical protein